LVGSFASHGVALSMEQYASKTTSFLAIFYQFGDELWEHLPAFAHLIIRKLAFSSIFLTVEREEIMV
jgi:hypothetical protein